MSANKYPPIVSKSDWEKKIAEFLVKEKELTRLTDKIAAERRRLPMHKIEKNYSFETSNGPKNLMDLFDGRRQLIVYHFMYDPSWEQGCPGCSWVVDGMPHEAHLNAAGVTLVIIGRAPLEKLLNYKLRMGWGYSWVSSYKSDFNQDFRATMDYGENHGVSVFMRNEKEIFQTYHSEDRGVDRMGSHYTYLDITPYGRQESCEDSPEGWPQDHIHKRHDSYENDGRDFK